MYSSRVRRPEIRLRKPSVPTGMSPMISTTPEPYFDSDAAAPGGFRRELDPGGEVELSKHVREVRLNRARRDEETLPDLRIRQPVGGQANDLELRRRQ